MSRAPRAPIALIVVLTVRPFAAHAEAPADAPDPRPAQATLASPQRIPERPMPEFTVPANVTVITEQEIRRSGALTIQEILAKAEGVTLLDAQGFGLNSDSGLTLRGINNGSRTNALVLLDGVRQNRFTGDEVHWQSMPLHNIERIEIIRGAGAAIYGEGALAGVINIITKHGGRRPLEGAVSAEAGSYGWQSYAVTANGRTEPFSYGTSYSRRLVGGYREFSSSRNTTVTAHGGVEVLPGTRLALNTLHSEDTTAFPGGLTPAQSEARRRQAVISRTGIFDDMTDQVSADLAMGPYQGVTSLISAYWRDREVDSLRSGLFTLTPSRGLNLRSAYEWTAGDVDNVLITGFELLDEKASTGTRGGSRTDESNHSGYATYVHDTVTVWDRVSLVAGFRYDRSRFDEDIIAFDSNFNEVNYVGTLGFEGRSPIVGVTVTIIPEVANLYASYSRPFKAPNVDDFASRSPEFQGNVALRPQQADTYEAGLRTRFTHGEAKTTAFYTRIDDEILFVQGTPSNPFRFQNVNVDTRRFGVENAARFELPHPRLRGYATYTFVDAEFRKGEFDGRTFPGTPEHLLNAGIGYSPIEDLWLDLDWQLVHGYFRINDVTNIFPADSFGVLNLQLRYALPEARRGWPQARAYLKVLNITNEEYAAFQSSNGHTLATGAGDNPMPPTTVVGGMDMTF